MICLLCNGSGLRLQYVLHPRRIINGQPLVLKPEPLSPEQYRELRATLPTSPLDWRPGMAGVLSVQSVHCACAPPVVMPGKPKPRKQKKAPAVRACPARWWDE